MISRRTYLALAGGALLSRGRLWGAAKVPAMLDHILVGCSDLDQGIAFVEQRTGVRASVGGVHPGAGTRNALLSLGELHYLEIIAPDPAQMELKSGSASVPDDLLRLPAPRIVGWAAHTDDIDAIAARLRKAGFAFHGPAPGSRKRPDGRVLNWRTVKPDDDRGGLIPFFIQWGAGSVHPSRDAAAGCSLNSFSVGGPDQEGLQTLFQKLGIEVQVEEAAKPQIRARITGPGGTLEITS